MVKLRESEHLMMHNWNNNGRVKKDQNHFCSKSVTRHFVPGDTMDREPLLITNYNFWHFNDRRNSVCAKWDSLEVLAGMGFLQNCDKINTIRSMSLFNACCSQSCLTHGAAKPMLFKLPYHPPFAGQFMDLHLFNSVTSGK